MNETALAAAFRNAGYQDREKKLYVLACEMLALTDQAQCHEIIARAARDKRGDDLPGKGQKSNETHSMIAQSRQPIEGETGHGLPEIHNHLAPSPSSQSDHAGHCASEALTTAAGVVAPQHDGQQGHGIVANQGYCAHPVVPVPAAPSNLVPVMSHIRSKPFVHSRASRGASAIGAIQQIAAKVIVFRLSDGRDIMDVRFGELRRIERKGRQGAREMIIARYLRLHCPYANPESHMTVGELYPPATLELAVAEANKEVANGAA